MQHKLKRCEGEGCNGCFARPDAADCMYHALAICEVCGAGEGGLTSEGCCGYLLTADAEEAVYERGLTLAELLERPALYKRPL